MNKRQIIILVSWSILLLWLGLIFYLSAQPVDKSNGLSKGVTKAIAEAIEKIAPKINLDIKKMNHLLRKNAHFFSYLVLGILMMNIFKVNHIGGVKGIILAIIACVIYAISDECHQLVVPGRGGQLKDVLIDSAGSIVGIGIYKMLYRAKAML